MTMNDSFQRFTDTKIMSRVKDGDTYKRISSSSKNRSDNMSDSYEDSEHQNLASKMEKGNQEIRLTFNKVILITHLNIFLYSACSWLQIWLIPYPSKNAAWYGFLEITCAIVQLAVGPLYGRFGDIFGSRAAMSLAFVSAALSYLLLSVSTSVPILFLSRLLYVLFMHALQGGQMIVTDLGDSGKRADALGKLGLSYGVGMVVALFVSALKRTFHWLDFAAFVAFLGSVLSICLVGMFVPKQTKKVQVEEKSRGALLDWRKWLSLIMAPGALFLLVLRVATGIPIGIVMNQPFKMTADQSAFSMAYIVILTMIVQGIGVGIVLKKVSENGIMKWASFLLVWSYLSLPYVSSIPQLCVVLAPLTIGVASLDIVISSALTRTVDEVDTGAMLGLNMATNSLILIVAPTIGRIMLKNLGFSSCGYLCFLSSGIVTAVLFVKYRNKA